jgi:D-alanine-D-alanine ligase
VVARAGQRGEDSAVPAPRVLVLWTQEEEDVYERLREEGPRTLAWDPQKTAPDVGTVAEEMEAILAALSEPGPDGNPAYDVSVVNVRDDVHILLDAIARNQPDVVLNLVEYLNDDATHEALVAGLYELLGVSYTGNGPLALATCQNKHRTKILLAAAGLPTPRFLLAEKTPLPAGHGLRFPLIVKPAFEDASGGIEVTSVVRDEAALEAQINHVLVQFEMPALVEEYIDGREIYVSLLGRVNDRPQIFPFFEIDFSDMPADRPKIVSFEGKWVEDSVEYRGTRPVRCEGLTPAMRSHVADTAMAAFDAIELRDYARMDIRLTAEGTPYVIDVNPNCDLSDLAGGFSKAARAGGLSYKDVILRIVSLALSRRPHADTIPIAERSRSAGSTHRPAGGESLPAGGSVLRARAPRGGAGSA